MRKTLPKYILFKEFAHGLCCVVKFSVICQNAVDTAATRPCNKLSDNSPRGSTISTKLITHNSLKTTNCITLRYNNPDPNPSEGHNPPGMKPRNESPLPGTNRHSISTGDSICILALGSGEHLLYPSNRVRAANPVSVRVRDMVSVSLSSAAVESPVLIESRTNPLPF